MVEFFLQNTERGNISPGDPNGASGGVLLRRAKKIVLGVVGISIVWFGILPPLSFPKGTMVVIPEGSSLRDAGQILRAHNIVRSSALLESYVILFDGERSIKAGEYFFPSVIPPFTVAARITNGMYGFTQISLTFPEGSMREDIARIASAHGALPFFSAAEFLSQTEGKEGYLFPDTYFFSQNARAENVVRVMEQNFDTHIKTKETDIASSGKKLSDIVTMASIIEEEARTPEDRRIVAGILWRRIAIGMPLQVDAAFLVVNGKKTNELTLEDLRADSPYNTYRYKGLPPGPIDNPGMDAIDAALHPTSSLYLYYLSDKNGVMHYAKTFEEHKANKKRYLL